MADDKVNKVDKKALHDAAHASKQKIGPKHGPIVDAFMQAVATATPQDEHGRLDAGFKSFLKSAEDMRNAGASVEDFFNAIEAFHENRKLGIQVIKHGMPT